MAEYDIWGSSEDVMGKNKALDLEALNSSLGYGESDPTKTGAKRQLIAQNTVNPLPVPTFGDIQTTAATPFQFDDMQHFGDIDQQTGIKPFNQAGIDHAQQNFAPAMAMPNNENLLKAAAPQVTIGDPGAGTGIGGLASKLGSTGEAAPPAGMTATGQKEAPSGPNEFGQSEGSQKAKGAMKEIAKTLVLDAVTGGLYSAAKGAKGDLLGKAAGGAAKLTGTTDLLKKGAEIKDKIDEFNPKKILEKKGNELMGKALDKVMPDKFKDQYAKYKAKGEQMKQNSPFYQFTNKKKSQKPEDKYMFTDDLAE